MAELPTLNGTPKQIKWADAARARFASEDRGAALPLAASPVFLVAGRRDQ